MLGSVISKVHSRTQVVSYVGRNDLQSNLKNLITETSL